MEDTSDDEDFAYELQVEEALSASYWELAYRIQLEEVLDASLRGIKRTRSRSSLDAPSSSKSKKRRKKRKKLDTLLVSDTSASETFECPICCERLEEDDLFKVRGCLHPLCLGCLEKFLRDQVKTNEVPIKCPQECPNIIEVEDLQGLLALDLVESYCRCLAEATIPEEQRMYCPYPDCSSLMCRDEPLGQPSSECMECHRWFCADCEVPWHQNITCEAFQKLPSHMREAEDVKLLDLANKQKWQRCEKCGSMIELNEGCIHMKCRCGHEFCYSCGSPWVEACRCR